jgi:hypothetical protein
MFNTKWNLWHEHGIHWLMFKRILCVPQDIDMLVIGCCCFVALQNGHPYVDKFMNYNCLVCFKVLLLCTTIYGLKKTLLNDGKLLCLTSLVIFFFISSCNCFWKTMKWNHMKWNWILFMREFFWWVSSNLFIHMLISCAIFVWLKKRHHNLSVWPYNAFGLFLWNECPYLVSHQL